MIGRLVCYAWLLSFCFVFAYYIDCLFYLINSNDAICFGFIRYY